MSLKILIAEDDRHTRRILEHIFTKDPAFVGHEVELFQAPDGEEAYRIFESENPDLVISDLLMPRMDGFALCRNIRKLPTGRNVPLIVTSAIYKETALLNKMREELGVEFFAKPFQVRELVRGVQRLLETRIRHIEGLQHEPAAEARSVPPAPPPEAPKSGDLASRPLARLILDVNETQSTGVLVLRRGRIKKEIHFIMGHPTGAESNIRSETLGHYMVAKRILDEIQHQTLLATARRDNINLMEAIVRLGWMSESDVLRHCTALVKLRIINSLRWREGTYEFVVGDTFSDRMPKCTIDSVALVLLGLKRLTIPDEVTRALEDDIHRPIRLTPRGQRLGDVFSKIYGDRLLDAAVSRSTISELIAKGLDPLLVYTHVHALLQTGMAELGDPRPGDARPAVPAEDPLTLDHLKAQAVTPRSQPDHETVLHQELFGVDEISVVTTLPVSTPSRELPIEDADVVDMAIPVLTELPPDTPGRGLSEEQARKLVVSTYLSIHQKNYYEILGVSQNCGESDIARAFQNLSDNFDVETFSRLDLGTDYPKLEELLYLFRQAYHVLSDPSLRADYDQRLKAHSRIERADPLEAELLFREGEQRIQQGQFDKARESLQQALAIDPEAADCHSHLAWALYQGASNRAEVLDKVWSHLNQALAIDPDLVSAHLHAGRIHADVGVYQKAAEHLEKLLDLDPSNQDAFIELSSLLETRGDFKILERLHRKVLHRLGSRFPDRTLSLWRGLAEIYAERLNNPDSARVCLEIASKLAPEDEEIRERLRAITEPEPTLWHDRRTELLGRLEARPDDAEPLQKLFQSAYSQKLYDAAYLCASALAVLDSTYPHAADYYRRFRPPFLQRARRIVDAPIWQHIRHPDDDPQIGEIFEILSQLPFGLGLRIEQTQTHTAQPADLAPFADHFGTVLAYLCHELALPVPEVLVRSDLEGFVATISDTSSPRLVVSRSLLEDSDHLRMAAALGVKLPFFWAGRAFGALYSRRQLKSLVMATMLLVAPNLKVPDPDGTIAGLRGRLADAPQDLQNRLSKTILSLTKQRSTLNVGRWHSGLFNSGYRLAATLVGDLKPVIPFIPHNQRLQSTSELIAFLLGDGHIEVRKHLGISIAV